MTSIFHVGCWTGPPATLTGPDPNLPMTDAEMDPATLTGPDRVVTTPYGPSTTTPLPLSGVDGNPIFPSGNWSRQMFDWYFHQHKKSDCDYPIMKPWFTDKTSRSQSYRNRLISLNYIKMYQFINSRSRDVYICEHALFISFRTYPWFVLFFLPEKIIDPG